MTARSRVRRRVPVALLAVATGALAASGCLAYHTGPMPGEPARADFAQVDGVRLRVADRGQGPPVVLLHGFASALETWTDVMAALEPDHRVIALDLMGFGWSDRPEADYSPSAQARLVLGLLDQLGIDRADFVGHSWGASVVLALALLAPERVARVALYDAWAYDAQLPSFFRWARLPGLGEALFAVFYDQRADERIVRGFHDPRRVTAGFVDDVERALERPGTTAAALAAVRGQRYDEIEARYRDITHPALLLWGREDEVAPLHFGERLAAELPDARLVVYPRCGHFPMIEAAAASTADLAAFLRGDGGP